MATTTPTHVDTSIPEFWAKQVLRSHLVSGFWGRFVGSEGSGSPIIQKTELKDGPGDLIHIQVTDPLTGAGQTGDTSTVEGNEENLTTSEKKVSPELYRHGVKVNRRANKKSILDLRSEARMRLAEWGMNKMDSIRFANLVATALPAPLGAETYAPNIFTAGGVDGTPTVDDIAAGDVLTVEEIQKIKLALRLQLAKPVMVDGRPHYILVTHPNTTFQLKQEERYESWVREAAARGENNPLFRGSLAVIDGLIIHDHESVPLVTNAGTVQVAKGIAFGAEFAVEGLDEDVSWAEDTFDYGHHFGVAYSFAFQPRRALELSSIQVYAAATDVV